MKILVLYNASRVDRALCPEELKNIGIHQEMKTNGEFDYLKVKGAFLLLELL